MNVDDSGSRVRSSPPPPPPEPKKKEEAPAPAAAARNQVPDTVATRAYAGESRFDEAPKTHDTHNVETYSASATSTQAAQATQGPSNPLKPESVARANKDYEEIKHSGAATTAFYMAKLRDNANDPDYQAQLMKRAMENPPNNIDYIVGGNSPTFGPNGRSEADKQLLLGAIKHARTAGIITDGEIRHRAEGMSGQGWREVANRLGITQVGSNPADAAAVSEVARAKGVYDTAAADVKELNERLQEQLADFGPALTDHQKQEYIKAFRADPKHSKFYDAEVKAAEQLAGSITRNQAQLERAAIADPQARDVLYNSLKSVANSPSAKVAVEFAVKVLASDKASPLAQAFGGKNIQEDILQSGIPNAAGQFQVETGDPRSGLQKLLTILDPLKNTKDALQGPGNIESAFQALELASKGKYDALQDLAGSWKDTGPLGKGLLGAGLVVGGMAAANAAQQGDYAELVRNVAEVSKGGLEVALGATQAMANSGKLAQYGTAGAKALSFAKFAEKLLPGLGMVAGAAAFVSHTQKLQKDPDIGLGVALLGDALTVLGSGVATIPGGQVPGAVASAIGGLITAGGELVSTFIKHKEFTDEQRKYLAAAGAGSLTEAFMNASGSRVKELTESLGLSPEQVQDLAARNSWIITDDENNAVPIKSFIQMTKDLKLSGDDVHKLMDSLVDYGENGSALFLLLNNMPPDGGRPRSLAQWKQYMREHLDDAGAPPAYRAAFQRTLDFLERG